MPFRPVYETPGSFSFLNIQTQQMQRRIVCAANRVGTVVIIGVRHFDAIMNHAFSESKLPKLAWYEAEQGFIDQFGEFCDRKMAWTIASNARQIINEVGGDSADGGTLYSENLY